MMTDFIVDHLSGPTASCHCLIPSGLKVIKTGLWVIKKMVTERSIDGSLVATNVTKLGVWFQQRYPVKKRDDRLIFSLQQYRYQERACTSPAFFPPAFHNWGLTYTYLLSKTDSNSLAVGGYIV